MAGVVTPEAARVAINAHQWHAAKRKPKVYGDRQIVDIGDDTLKAMTDEQLDARLAHFLSRGRGQQ